MKDVSELFLKCIGVRLKDSDEFRLKNGFMAQRTSFVFGRTRVPLILIEVNPNEKELQNAIEDLRLFVAYEVVLFCTTGEYGDSEMEILRSNKIGYLDSVENYYLPLEIKSVESKRVTEPKKDRGSNYLNEFYIGYLFLRGCGALDGSQASIGSLIKKSPSTVNATIKKMVKEGNVLKRGRGYHLVNIEQYFTKWCYLLEKYKNNSLVELLELSITEEAFKKLFHVSSGENQIISISGERADSELDDGYLTGAKDFIIYTSEADLKKIKYIFDFSKNKSNIDSIIKVPIYQSRFPFSPVGGNNADEFLIAGDLMSSSNSRVREAGLMRLNRYLRLSKEKIYERYN
jgi:hypothetical protein